MHQVQIEVILSFQVKLNWKMFHCVEMPYVSLTRPWKSNLVWLARSDSKSQSHESDPSLGASSWNEFTSSLVHKSKPLMHHAWSTQLEATIIDSGLNTLTLSKMTSCPKNSNWQPWTGSNPNGGPRWRPKIKATQPATRHGCPLAPHSSEQSSKIFKFRSEMFTSDTKMMSPFQITLLPAASVSNTWLLKRVTNHGIQSLFRDQLEL